MVNGLVLLLTSKDFKGHKVLWDLLEHKVLKVRKVLKEHRVRLVHKVLKVRKARKEHRVVYKELKGLRVLRVLKEHKEPKVLFKVP